MAQSAVVTFSDGYGTHKYCCEINLWWTDNGGNSAKLHASGGAWLYNSTGWNGSYLNFAGVKREGNCADGPTDYYWKHSNWWTDDYVIGTYTKTHAARTIYQTCTFNYGGKGEVSVTASAILGAKWSYVVRYNAGEGSGAPGDQMKWHDENLTISSVIPTRPGFAFKGWSGADGKTYLPGSTYKANSATVMTAVWQAMVTDLEDVADCEIGEAPVIAFTPQSTGLTYFLDFELGDWRHGTQPFSPYTTDRYVYDSYTIPMEVCSQLPEQTEGLMKITLETWDYSNIHAPQKLGESIKYCAVTVPESVVPAVTFTAADATANLLGIYLQNYSYLKLEPVITPAYDSGIEETTITLRRAGDEEPYETLTFAGEEIPEVTYSDILPYDGQCIVTVSARDKRGRVGSAEQTIQVTEYSLPTVSMELSLEEPNILVQSVHATYDTVGGINQGYLSFDGGMTRIPIQPDHEAVTRTAVEYPESRNYTKRITIYDTVTSVTAVQKLHPGRGDRFRVLDEDAYYIGIDQYGWKDTLSEYRGGINDDNVIWFERTSGNGPLGIGFPVQMDPDSDYELIYSANKVDDDTVALVSFFQDEGTGERGIHYLGTTYDGQHLHSGAIFHTPELSSGTMWGLVIFGVDPASYEDIPIGYQEISEVVVRKVERKEEELEWKLETGNLGLDTPNQKYISRLQMRIEYVGWLRVSIAYDNSPHYEEVHANYFERLMSTTVAINVRRADHFRLKLEGTGQAYIYSMGYYTDEGSTRC